MLGNTRLFIEGFGRRELVSYMGSAHFDITKGIRVLAMSWDSVDRHRVCGGTIYSKTALPLIRGMLKSAQRISELLCAISFIPEKTRRGLRMKKKRIW